MTLGQPAPEFAVRTHRDHVEVRGTASSAAHRSVLGAAALRYAPKRSTDFDVTVAARTPSGWSVITELALRIGLTLEEGEVLVTLNGISITGTTRELAALDQLRSRLGAVRQPGMRLESRVIEVSADQTPFSTFCRRQFYSLARDNRVRYVDSFGQLRSGARAALDRLVELMHDCPKLKVAVRGRTKSAAAMVAGYLTGAGIGAERVQAAAKPEPTTEAPPAAQRDVVFEVIPP